MQNIGSIHLRPLEDKDSMRMLEWMKDEDVVRYLTIGGKDTTLDQIQKFIQSAKNESRNVHRAIVDKNDNYLGTVSLKNIDYEKKEAEYAISLHPNAIGKGVAQVATNLILEYAFYTLGLYRVYLNVLEENKRAVRFYEKCGFIFTHTSLARVKNRQGRFRWYQITKGKFVDKKVMHENI